MEKERIPTHRIEPVPGGPAKAITDLEKQTIIDKIYREQSGEPEPRASQEEGDRVPTWEKKDEVLEKIN